MTDGLPRIGVAGCGWWATQFHIPALLEAGTAQLAALADPDPARLTAAAARFRVDAAFADAGELVDAGLVDGLVVAVPHAAHFPVALRALEAGVSVLVEKPLVLAARDARALISASERSGASIVVGCTFQFTRSAARVREVVRAGEIGELVCVSGLFASMVEAYYRGTPDDYRDVFGFPIAGPLASTYSDPAISGGGQAQTQLSHLAGMALWVTGARVEEVSAFMVDRDLPVDLADGIAFRLEGGAVGTMASTGSLKAGQPQQQELRYYGTRGYVLQDLRDGSVVIQRDGAEPEVLPPLPADEVYPAGGPITAFAALLAGGTHNPAPAEPAARTVEFLEASYRSAAEGRSVRVAELYDGAAAR